MEKVKTVSKKDLTNEEFKEIISEQMVEELEEQLTEDDDYIKKNYNLEDLRILLDDLEDSDEVLTFMKENICDFLYKKIIDNYLLNNKEINCETIDNIYNKLNLDKLYFNKYKVDIFTAFIRNSVNILKIILKQAGLEVD